MRVEGFAGWVQHLGNGVECKDTCLVTARSAGRARLWCIDHSAGSQVAPHPPAVCLRLPVCLPAYWCAQILFWKKRAEEALQRSGLPYTVVRPGGLKSKLSPGESSAGSIVMGRPGTYGFPPLQKSGSILRSQVRVEGRGGVVWCACRRGGRGEWRGGVEGCARR